MSQANRGIVAAARAALAPVLLALLALAAGAACKKDGAELPPGFGPRGPAVDVAKLAAPPLFAHIPADTPYVVAAFEAVPLDYYAKIRRALGPALERSFEQLRASARDTELDRWFDAITGELDGKWSAQGLESLGLSAQPRFAIYGHGALPVVMRLEIKDDKALLATIERVAQRAGARLPALETRHGREFWRVELPGDAGAIVSIADRQLVAAYGPRHAVAAALPQILGAEKPARNMADGEELKRLIARHHLGPLMIGYVDSKRLAGALVALAERAPPAACTTQIDRLAAQVPRLVLSYTELTDKRFSAATIVELAPPLAQELKALRAAVPGLSAALAGEPLLAFGGGIDLARGQAAGKALAGALRELGEACDAEELVRGARKLHGAMSEPLPGPLAKIAGGAVAVDAIDFGGGGRRSAPSMPRSFEGFALLAATDAKAVFEALGEAAPPLRMLDLAADGKLHDLELTKLGVPFDVRGGVGGRAIVVAAGDRGVRQAEQALAATAGDPGPFLAAPMDLRRLMELQAKIDPAAARAFDSGMLELFGRMTFSVDATDAGLAMWMSGELK